LRVRKGLRERGRRLADEAQARARAGLSGRDAS